MFTEIRVPFFGQEETLTVEYKENSDPREAGFHLLNLPFPIEDSVGYPVIHIRFRDMKTTGYGRYCGFIQFIERTETNNGVVSAALSLDVAPEFEEARIPYFSYGYPASLFDAPCRNLRGCERLQWTAYTYLVEMPTRMNGDRIGFLAGVSWGYTEDQNGPAGIRPLSLLDREDWAAHREFLDSWMARR